jgi:response regulator NasT
VMSIDSPNSTHPVTLTDCHAELDQLRTAMASRPMIDMAKGILIARHGCTPDEAFEMLSAASQRENRKLREVAVAVVASTCAAGGRS